MPIVSSLKPVPLADEPLHVTVLRAARRVAIHRPDRPAFIDAANPERRCTFGQFWLECTAIAGWLRDRGFKRGQVNTLCMHNAWEYASFSLGTNIAGGAPSGASAVFTEFEYERQFRDNSTRFVLTEEALLDKVVAAARKVPTVQAVIVLGDREDYPFGVIRYSELLNAEPMLPTDVPIDIEKDCAVLPYSSGTTGAPKGVVLSHRAFNTMLRVVLSSKPGDPEEDFDSPDPVISSNMLAMLPAYHIFGYALLLMGLLNRQTTVVMAKFEPRVFLESIQNFAIPAIFVVPPVVLFLAKHPLVDNYDLSSLMFVACGAAPLGRETVDELQQRLPNIAMVHQGYGMTELSLACTQAVFDKPSKPGSCGRIAPNCEVMIVDLSTGKEVPRGQTGEVWVKTAMRMSSYLNREKETASTIDENGWIHTGDVGYVDDDDELFIVDRIKELIKVKGLQVAPAELEQLLLTHPGILDAAVVGIPDDRSGELPRAYVVAATKTVAEKDVQSWLADRVAPYKRLDGGVRFVREIPRSPAGKILRRQLRDEASKELANKSAKL